MCSVHEVKIIFIYFIERVKQKNKERQHYHEQQQ